MALPPSPTKPSSPTRPANVPALTIKAPSIPVKRSVAELRAAAGIIDPVPSTMKTTAAPATVTPPKPAATPTIPMGLRLQLDGLTSEQRTAAMAYLVSLGKSDLQTDAVENVAAKPVQQVPGPSCWQQLATAMQGCIAPPRLDPALDPPASAAGPSGSADGVEPPPPPPVPAIPVGQAAAAKSDGALGEPVPLLKRDKSAMVIQDVWRRSSRRMSKASDILREVEGLGPLPHAATDSKIDLPSVPAAVQAAYDAAAAEAAAALSEQQDAERKAKHKPSNIIPSLTDMVAEKMPSFRPRDVNARNLPGMPGSIKSTPQVVPPSSISAMPGMPGSILATPQLKA